MRSDGGGGGNKNPVIEMASITGDSRQPELAQEEPSDCQPPGHFSLPLAARIIFALVICPGTSLLQAATLLWTDEYRPRSNRLSI